jgi:predicted PurR-regulated permease PerM
MNDERGAPVGNSTGPQAGGAGHELSRVALTAVAVVAVLAGLYLAQAVLLPVVLALLLSFLFRPVIRFLSSFWIPETIGAALLVASLIGAGAVATYLLFDPASRWVQRAPFVVAELEYRLQDVLEAIRFVDEATEEVERRIGRTEDAATVTVEVKEATLRGLILSRTWQFFGGLAVMLFLLYFLLASGDLFLRKLVRVLPRLEDKKRAVEIAREIQQDVSSYLLTITLINAGLGTAVGFAMYLTGMPNPILWGVLAGLLNFMPYLGPTIMLAVLTVVSLLSFDTLGTAALPPAIFLVLTSLEGQLFTPLILGRRLTLNPVLILFSLIFWGWLWGIIGVLLAVPILMVLKILCTHIPPLWPVGEFLSR